MREFMERQFQFMRHRLNSCRMTAIHLALYAEKDNAHGAGKNNEQDRGESFLFPERITDADKGDDEEDDEGSPVERERAVYVLYAEQNAQKHDYGSGEDHTDDSGTNGAEDGLYALIFQNTFQNGRNQKDDNKRRQNDAEGSKERTQNAGLRRTDEGGHIDGKGAGSGLGYGDEIKYFVIGQPTRGEALFPHQRTKGGSICFTILREL